MNILDRMQPTPVPFLEMALQHAVTWVGLQYEEEDLGSGTASGAGSEVAAMAMEMTLRRSLDCILRVGRLMFLDSNGLRGWVLMMLWRLCM